MGANYWHPPRMPVADAHDVGADWLKDPADRPAFEICAGRLASLRGGGPYAAVVRRLSTK